MPVRHTFSTPFASPVPPVYCLSQSHHPSPAVHPSLQLPLPWENCSTSIYSWLARRGCVNGAHLLLDYLFCKGCRSIKRHMRDSLAWLLFLFPVHSLQIKRSALAGRFPVNHCTSLVSVQWRHLLLWCPAPVFISASKLSSCLDPALSLSLEFCGISSDLAPSPCQTSGNGGWWSEEGNTKAYQGAIL